MKTIKSSILVTFDFSQRGKSGTGLAAGSLLSACFSHPDHAEKFVLTHLPLKMINHDGNTPTPEKIVDEISKQVSLCLLDSIALACYVWSSSLIESVINLCRENGFSGNIILGGYQISKESCYQMYPSGDIYIPGYAEASLPVAILAERVITKRIIDIPVNFEVLPSPYLDGTIKLEQNQEMIHWETRRGCVFKCNFCAHRDLKDKKVNLFNMHKIKEELVYFKGKNVQKINVLDPVFNLERNHLEILRYAVSIEIKTLLVFQVRFECITQEFIDLCLQLNVHLEFGLQTAIKNEFKLISRPNHLRKVSESIAMLHRNKLSFEVSLIYGLPGQTLKSFKKSIEYLIELCVTNIKAFPLMLLEGTQLAKEKSTHQITEGIIDDSGIPHVVTSSSFSKTEWLEMHVLAKTLNLGACIKT